MTKFLYMDLLTAHRLLAKIQSLLDQPSTLSMLEQDLVKSYILQLYEAVSKPDEPAARSTPDALSGHGSPEERPVPAAPFARIHAQKPQAEVTRESRVDHDRVTPFVPLDPMPPKEAQPDQRFPADQTEMRPRTPDPLPHRPAYTPAAEFKYDTVSPASPDAGEAEFTPGMLFDPPLHSEPTGTHVVLSSIEEGISINDRIFILRDLFGGDASLMAHTFDRLNGLHSFAEAREMLVNGAALTYHWAHPETRKKAVEFIRILRRRYPSA